MPTLKAIVEATPTPAPTAEPVDVSRVYNNLASELDTVAKKVRGRRRPTRRSCRKLRSGDSASVTVAFVVTEEGEVAEAKVVESGGGKVLDEAVLAAVRSWKYSPAVKRGIKVKVRITLKQTFRAG